MKNSEKLKFSGKSNFGINLAAFEPANATFSTLGLRFWNFWASLKEHPPKPQEMEKKSIYRYLVVTGDFFKKRVPLLCNVKSTLLLPSERGT